eukprot:11170-Heterococcus_DN1.PRE.2
MNQIASPCRIALWRQTSQSDLSTKGSLPAYKFNILKLSVTASSFSSAPSHNRHVAVAAHRDVNKNGLATLRRRNAPRYCC